jgi:hypothetical protein
MPIKKQKTIKRTSNNKLTNKYPIPKWMMILLIAVITGMGIFLIFRSFAATVKPNLRFQIQKNGVCTNSVNRGDSTVNIKITRDSGTATINNIRVYVDGSPVATSPTSIAGPVTNLAIASPNLADSPSTHRISVSGNNTSQGAVTFSPYCEANGSTGSTVSVGLVSPSQPSSVTPISVPTSTSTSPTPTGARLSQESGSPSVQQLFRPRPGIVYCNQGSCSLDSRNGGRAQNVTLQPTWNCRSGWKYQTNYKDNWYCTAVYTPGSDSVIAPWIPVAMCESGGNWSINTGNGYYGGLQFDLSTWRSVGGQGYPHQASAHEQASRAEILRSQRGLSPWPVCGRYYGTGG